MNFIPQFQILLRGLRRLPLPKHWRRIEFNPDIKNKLIFFLNRVEYAAGFIVLLACCLFIYTRMTRQLYDPDVWLHLKTGEYILREKAVPTADPFSFTLEGKSWINHSWLTQVIFYLVFSCCGIDGLLVFSALIVTAAFLLLFFSVYDRRKNLLLLTLILIVTVLASQLRLNIRPENFSLVFFSLYLFILKKYRQDKRIFLLGFIQLLWVNFHGFFIIGPLFLGIVVTAEKFKRLPGFKNNKDKKLDNSSYKNLIRAFGLVCLACFINPYWYKGVLYPFIIMGKAFSEPVSYGLITELLPISFLNKELAVHFYLLVVIGLGVFLTYGRTINKAYAACWLILLLVSIKANRNIIFFNFLTFWIAGNALSDLSGKPRQVTAKIFLSIIILKLAVAGWYVNEAYAKIKYTVNKREYLLEEHRVKSGMFGVTPNAFPEKTADFILKEKPPGRLFNLFNYGSYLIWRLYPQYQVFIDGRTELYGDAFLKTYRKICAGDKQAIFGFLDDYAINTVLLNNSNFETQKLASYLYNSGQWIPVYLEDKWLILLKNSQENQGFINRLKIDTAGWQTNKVDINKIGLIDIGATPYLNRAFNLYTLSAYEPAINEVKEALRITPDDTDAYNILAAIYLRQKEYDKAFESLRLAYRYGRHRISTLLNFADFYRQKKNLKKAREIYEILVKRYPRFAKGYYLLAESYFNENNQKMALKMVEQAVKLNPFHSEHYRLWRQILLKNKADSAAKKVYEKAKELGLDVF